MVVKPLDFAARGREGPAPAGRKVRGREYLRIIYGPEYLLPANLERLRPDRWAEALAGPPRVRPRGRGAGTLRRDEPLYRVHECIAGVLALEAEPVDPRL